MKSNKQLRPILIAGIIGMMLMACGNDPQQGVNTPLAQSVTPAAVELPVNKTLCFLQVSGNRNQDTLSVQLNFNGDQVTGSMANVIYQKDARRGTLSGLLLQPDIKAVWTYTQEGMQDSMEVDFRLGNDALMQKPFINQVNGREITDSNAGYTIKIPMMDCGS